MILHATYDHEGNLTLAYQSGDHGVGLQSYVHDRRLRRERDMEFHLRRNLLVAALENEFFTVGKLGLHGHGGRRSRLRLRTLRRTSDAHEVSQRRVDTLQRFLANSLTAGSPTTVSHMFAYDGWNTAKAGGTGRARWDDWADLDACSTP